ncbi:MAG: hypothetical protein GX418_12050 [Clostridiales bacterium]|nr:hypothetical protein [Clostridiales bacterium]
MAERLKRGEALVRIGQTALRAPDGTYLPAVPLYIKVKASEVDKTEVSEGEHGLAADMAGVFAKKYKQYVDGTKPTKRTQKGKAS